jgi:hypothetical protein
MESEEFKISDLIEAKLTFFFQANRTDNYSSICKAVLVDANANVHEGWVDEAGKRSNKTFQLTLETSTAEG